MFAWMLLLHIGNPFQESVDVLETNHVYSRKGEYVFAQVIAWNRDAMDGRLHNVGWHMVRYRYDHVHKGSGSHFVRHERGFVTSKRHVERWLDFDIESEDRKEFWKGESPNVFMEVRR